MLTFLTEIKNIKRICWFDFIAPKSSHFSINHFLLSSFPYNVKFKLLKKARITTWLAIRVSSSLDSFVMSTPTITSCHKSNFKVFLFLIIDCWIFHLIFISWVESLFKCTRMTHEFYTFWSVWNFLRIVSYFARFNRPRFPCYCTLRICD